MKTFETRDTGLATALLSNGFVVNGFRNEGKSVFMLFKETDELLETEKRYWAKDLKIDSQTLLFEYRSLKQRISNYLKFKNV